MQTLPETHTTTPSDPQDAVLDTQVVLDWLVFQDPAAAMLAQAVEAGRLRWLTSAAMRAELWHVLDRGVAAAWRPDRAAIAAALDRLACRVEPGPLPLPGLRCTDPDDQMFINLALCTRSAWLFTRDRALLSLARRARPLGVEVIRPADWRPAAPAAARGG